MKADLSVPSDKLKPKVELNKISQIKLVGFTNLTKNLFNSFSYSAIQEPINGLTQIYDHVTNSQVEKNIQFFSPPKQSKFGSVNWVANQVGSGLGIAVDFMLTDKIFGSSNSDLTKSAIIKKAALSGGIYEGVFSPNSSSGNFWLNRTKDALSGALTFASMAQTSLWENDLAAKFESSNAFLSPGLNSTLIHGVSTGVVGGLISANSQSILNTDDFATLNQNIQSVSSFIVAGIPLSMGETFIKTNHTKQSLEPNLDLTSINDMSLQSRQEMPINPIQELFPKIKMGNTDLIKIPIYDVNANIIHTFNFNIPQFPNFPDIPEYILPEEGQCLFDGEHYTTENDIMISKKGSNTTYLFPDDTKILAGLGITSIQLEDGQLFNIMNFQKTYKSQNNTYKINDDGDSVIQGGKSNIYFSKNKANEILYKNPQAQLEITLTPTSDPLAKLPYSIKAKLNNTSLIMDSAGNYNASLEDGSSISKIGSTLSHWSKDGIETIKDKSGKIEVIDHNIQYQELLKNITEKFNQDHFRQAEYNALLDKFNPQDKPIAKAILDLSLPNLSPQNLLKSIRTIELNNLPIIEDNYFYSINASSIGSMLGYLGSKALANNFNILTFDEIPRTSKEIRTFDRPDKLDHKLIHKLEYDQGKKITYINLNNFEDGLNFLDRSQDRLETKLAKLVNQANNLRQSSNDFRNLSNVELAQKLLNQKIEKFCQANDIVILKPKKSTKPEDWLMPPASQEVVNDFLNEKESIYQQDFKYKFELAKFLSDTVEYNSIASILQKCQNLYTSLAIDLASSKVNNNSQDYNSNLTSIESGIKQIQNSKFVIGLDGENGASSAAFINYLFKISNNLNDSNFISRQQFYNLRKDPNARFIYLDDTAYSGTQLEDTLVRYFDQDNPKLHIGLLGAFKDFYKSFKANNNIGITTLQTHFPLSTDFIDEQINALKAKLMNSALSLKTDNTTIANNEKAILNLWDLKQLLAFSNSFGNINSALVWPYMVPDNSFNLLPLLSKKLYGFQDNHDTI